MKSSILYLFTRTPLHVGAGNSVGAIDQPIQRERHTGFPIIPGSSLKGVIRDAAQFAFKFEESKVKKLFGRADEDMTPSEDSKKRIISEAGIVSFAEARILLFPLRSAKGSYVLATCPLALSRFARDHELNIPVPEQPKDMDCLGSKAVSIDSKVVIEEYAFKNTGVFPSEWADKLCHSIKDAVLNASKEHLVLLSNGDFSHFVQNACPVNQHVSIDDETGTAKEGALFNEETVPSESLFYCVLHPSPRHEDHNKIIKEFVNKFATPQLMQFGGNATSGLGYTTVSLSANQ